MKRIALALGVLLLGIAALAALRAATLRTQQVAVERAQTVKVDGMKAAQRLALAIRLRTISHQDRAQMNAKPFQEFAGVLRGFYPLTRRRLSRERVNELSLLYTWKGRNPELDPVLLAAHLDVVPVDPASEADWKHPPFEGIVENAIVWGRGAIDDKVSVITILEAVERLLAENFQPERTIYLAFGHDEEVGGDEGALAIARLLESRGFGSPGCWTKGA